MGRSTDATGDMGLNEEAHLGGVCPIFRSDYSNVLQKIGIAEIGWWGLAIFLWLHRALRKYIQISSTLSS